MLSWILGKFHCSYVLEVYIKKKKQKKTEKAIIKSPLLS